ncbi:DUF2264 domain-containing protein [Pedobacter gandavensis]|uniref:DUF2264 domain-containing protein n=1 Tax=Pedobacter gandavensis TaxID=2679963 RepID=A0ABR6ERB3_9SPHI|nr:DUF2264 domain-containing protein [Pedobacter gandavensis]MBB2147582.1 DUF2264 domain-containing protein [Pedobacter gandavensis]
MRRMTRFPVLMLLILIISLGFSAFGKERKEVKPERYNSREYWVSVLVKIADPVLKNLSKAQLRAKMPVDCKEEKRKEVAHLEAFGRTLAGITPWLELGPDKSPEGKLRATYIDLTRKALANAVDPSSPDFLNFSAKHGQQPLVDAAFLAQGLLRGYTQLWEPLDQQTKQNIVNALKSSRSIKPGENNWLLFRAIIEAFLLKSGNSGDMEPITYALSKHESWYKGDGAYGDGADFHWDYYNSFVIQPMILDITKVLKEHGTSQIIPYDKALKRAQRYAAVQERMISPEGTFPPIGRSLVYRFGAFQVLSQIALLKELPAGVSPAQVRTGLSLVIYRLMEAPNTFDAQGWLKLGMFGYQPNIGEYYITTGSLYLCSVGLLPLGLPANDPFWTSPAQDWTSKKVWQGIDLPADHAYKESN